MSSSDLRNGKANEEEMIIGIESDETNSRVCKARLIARIIAYSASVLLVAVAAAYSLITMSYFASSVFFVVVAAAYVCLIVGALVYLRWWAGLALIAFLSPYFIMMLRAIPFLRDVYINVYATSPAPKELPN